MGVVKYNEITYTNRDYTTWYNMIKRCTDENHTDYHNYGGRGVLVCEEWINDFQKFVKDMGNKSKGLTLDRINNNLGYYKDNCKWATQKEQCNNRRSNVNIEINGDVKNITQLSKETGIKVNVLYNRFHKKGWTIESLIKDKNKKCTEKDIFNNIKNFLRMISC